MRENNVVKPLWSLWFCDNIPVRSQECAEYGTEFGLWMWACDCSSVSGLFQSLAPDSLLLPQMLPQHWSCWLLCPSKPCVPVNTWIVLGLGDPVGPPTKGKGPYTLFADPTAHGHSYWLYFMYSLKNILSDVFFIIYVILL